MKRPKVSEQQLGEVVVAWLEALGADVYQEVQVSGGVADIVARVRAEIWIVEVKTSLSLALVAQAMDRRRLAHRVFVAAPHSRTMRDVEWILRETGIGLIDVCCETGWGEPRVEERVRSRRHNRRPVDLATRLQPEHKTHAKAGAVGGGGRWTPFRRTCELLASIVKREPGITLKAAIQKVDHHYASTSSAVGSLAHWCEKGKVDGVRVERSHGTHGALVLRPSEVSR